MKSHFIDIRKRVLAWTLLFIIVIAVIPVTLLHHHAEDDLPCKKDNARLEQDPCHLSIFHQADNKNACEHKTHVHKKYFTCKLCEFSRTIAVCELTEPFCYNPVFNAGKLKTLFHRSCPVENLSEIFGRGPPVDLIIS